MGDAKKEILPGVYEITNPDGTKLIVGDGWSSHIHTGDDWYNIKVEKTGETIKGFRDFNAMIDTYLPDSFKKD